MNLKNWFARFHLSVTIGFAFLICVLSYLIIRNIPLRINFEDKKPTVERLSTESKDILAKFGTEKIQVRAFFAMEQLERENMESLLEEYARTSPSFKFEMIDPDRSPAKAKEAQVDSYGVTIIKARGEELRIDNPSEREITNALKKLLSGFKRDVYFVVGHNEPKLKNDHEDGYLFFSRMLKGRGYDIKGLDLSQVSIPKDTDLVVLAGPHSDLTAAETNALSTYLQNGGKLFLAFDPVYQGEGEKMKKFLKDWGVDLGNDVIIDKLSKEMGGDLLIAMSTEYGGEALKDFKQTAFFPVARSVRAGNNPPKGWDIAQAVKTSLGSWAETNLMDLEKEKADYDEGVDLPGPVSIAISAKGPSNGKLFVIGDSDFLNNGHIHMAGNQRFAAEVFNWLLNDSLSPTNSGNPRVRDLFVLSPKIQIRLFYFSVIAMPLFFLAIGFFIFWSRRRFI